jgi:hypothetical protein
MVDVATILVTINVVIDLLGRLVKNPKEKREAIRENLVALRTDLDIIKDIMENIINSKRGDLKGVQNWMEEASSLVNDAQKLLKRIGDENNKPYLSKNEAKQLKKLMTKYDSLAKHNQTIVLLINQPIQPNQTQRRPLDWLLCRCCL